MGNRWRHFITISKHKAVVFSECRKCGLFWRGLVHDMSKFSPAEFVSSARYFQGNHSPIEAEKAEIGYSKAWMHHKGHNPHHWEYWIDYDEKGQIIANKIPYKYVIEMVCDWIGAGQVYSGDTWDTDQPLRYYKQVRPGRHFHPATEELLLVFLSGIKDNGLDWFHRRAKSVAFRVTYEQTGGGNKG